MNKKLRIAIAALAAITTVDRAAAQAVRLDGMEDNFKKENLLKLNGGLAANAVFDGGAGASQRDPFVWFVNGNLNARFFNLIDVPISMFITNSGRGLNYPTPPTRLSIHPSYKWATAHIGDIAMAFSPYTLNGHQFTGVGVDLTPPGRFKASAMYGRLQKAQEYDSANHSTPASYKRMGYGAKISYEADRWRIGYTAFTAKDDPTSIGFVPDSLDIAPKQNVVMSWDGNYKLTKGLELSAEYATSGMTTDRRDTMAVSSEGVQILQPLMSSRGTTSYYKAIRANLNYAFAKSVIGLGYERIDPGYRTLGAYFFNEDLENYTVNLSQSALKDKLSLSGNFGFQRDDLDGRKSGNNMRFIGAVNANYAASEKLNLSGSYSNFQTYMHIKSQFERINQIGPYVNYDTLRFSQISQNAGLNVFYMLGRNDFRMHALNLNLNFFDAVDRQGDIVRNGSQSQFYNGALAYSLQFPQKSITASAGLNANYNTIGRNNFLTIGPLVALGAQFFDKKLGTNLAASYNTSSGTGTQKSDVFNTRLSASYAFLKKHNLNLGIMNQLRNGAQGKSSDLISTLSYGFSF